MKKTGDGVDSPFPVTLCSYNSFSFCFSSSYASSPCGTVKGYAQIS